MSYSLYNHKALEQSTFCRPHSTPFVCNESVDFILKELKRKFHIATDWFQNNYMKMNSGKCHLFAAGHKFEQL